MCVWANFADTYLREMCDRGKRSETELAREIQLTDWSTAGNLSNRSSRVQIPCDSCTRFRRYLYEVQVDNKYAYYKLIKYQLFRSPNNDN